MNAICIKNPAIYKKVKDVITSIILENDEEQVKVKIKVLYGSDLLVPNNPLEWYTQFRKSL